ncbi:MAG: hypothetical protein ACK5H2_03290 [Beutenbergiaceae bacterium]
MSAPSGSGGPESSQPDTGPGGGPTGEPSNGYGQYSAADQRSGWGQPPQVPAYGATDSGPAGDSDRYGQFGTPQEPTFTATQPGIIPLRPITLGEIYDGAIKAIRANPGVMFGLSAAVVTVASLIQVAALWGTVDDLYALPATDPDIALDELYATLNLAILPSLVTGLVTFVSTTILNGLLIHSVTQSVIGRRLPLAELWRLVQPQLLRLLALSAIILAAVIVVIGLTFVPLLLAVSLLAPASVVVLAGGISMLAALAAAFFIIIATLLATPVLVVERAGLITALRRAWQLTRHSFWRVTGIYLLTALLAGVVGSVITAPFAAISGFTGPMPALTVAQLASATVATAITTPFVAAVIALLYVDIRIRTEGLDAELAAAAQEQ